MQKLRILHVVGSTDRAGAGVAASVCDLCSALADSARITIVAGRGQGELYPVDARVRRVLCPTRRIAGLRLSLSSGFQRRLDEVLAEGADLVHIHGLWMAEVHLACCAARRRGIPYVISLHGMLMPWAFQHKRWKKILPWLGYQRADLRQAAALIASSAPEEKAIRAFGFSNPILTIPHGIHVPPWEAPRNGIAPRKVVFLGRLHPIKGLMNLVDAWCALRPPGWQLILAGPDENNFQQALQNRIQQNHQNATAADRTSAAVFASEAPTTPATNGISFTGPLNDHQKWQLLRQADLLVLPSFTENFGLVVLEALSCGVPVITTRGTPWECLEGGGGGWRVEGGGTPVVGDRLPVNCENTSHLPPSTLHHPPSTSHPPPAPCPIPSTRCGWWIEIGVTPLAEALQEAMGLTDEQRREMGRRGAEMVRERFAWSRVGLQMAEVYDWVARGGPTPDCVKLQ